MAAPMDQDVTEELRSTERLTGTTPGGALTLAAENDIELARITNMVAAAIASLSWGGNMSGAMRRAWAEYGRRYDVDPITEMDNLGGTPYVNADWFKRKLGELRMAGVIKSVKLEHIHADARLDALRKSDTDVPDEIRAEAARRWFDALFKRVKFNAPDKAEAICVCTITLADGSTIEACKWAGNGTSVKQPRSGGASAPNPIAENNAAAYVESSSQRRAALQLFSHLTGRGQQAPDAGAMRAEHQRLTAEVRVATPAPEPEPEPKKLLAVATAADGAYGLT
jgi:hypothetical protein